MSKLNKRDWKRQVKNKKDAHGWGGMPKHARQFHREGKTSRKTKDYSLDVI